MIRSHHGLERAQSHKSAWLVGAVSLVLVLIIAYCVWFAGARVS